jgi:large subunit ribosomal protein L3
MKVLLATKQSMTQHFAEDGIVTPVTVLSGGEMTVVTVKTSESDGYSAVQFGHGQQKESRLSKAEIGQRKGLGNFRKLKEFRNEDGATFEAGQKVGVDQFTPGDLVDVTSVSKGKGFQGVVKRHGFKGKGSIHHARHALREPGSIGGGGRAGGRVIKGMKMAGRMGGERITVKNLRVVAVDPTTNTILVKGAVPGIKGALVEVVKI